MGRCENCGKNIGLLSTGLCNTCKQDAEREAKERADEEEQKRIEHNQQVAEQKRVEREQGLSRIANSKLTAIKKQIDDGNSIILFNEVYLPVDSKVVKENVVDQFSLGTLRRYGINGWDVVAVIPRTSGVALTNVSLGASSGQTWGAGVGGNIIGVYLVLKKELTHKNCPSDEVLQHYIKQHLADILDEEESKAMNDVLNSTK